MTRRSTVQALVQPNNWDRVPTSIDRKTSPEYLDALDKLERYMRLRRLPGGYWTYEGVSMVRIQSGEHVSYDRPEWYAITPTVRALIERGRAAWAGDGADEKGDVIILVPRPETG